MIIRMNEYQEGQMNMGRIKITRTNVGRMNIGMNKFEEGWKNESTDEKND